MPQPRPGHGEGPIGARPPAGPAPAAGPPLAADSPTAATAPPAAAPRPERRGSGRTRWRWPAVAALGSILLTAGATGLVLSLARHGAPPGRPPGSRPGTSPPLNAEAVARTQAIAWILHEVSRAAVVACDAQVCADLAGQGFPSASLRTLSSQSYDPLGANLVVATAAIRAQYGPRLASVYAPAVIASFGSGNARIEIRLEPPGGTVDYRAMQQAAARARKTADAQLLKNHRITFSAKARAQLRSGDIDPRLPLLIATMAQRHPVRIMDFTDQSPGGGPASLLRSMDVATSDEAAHLPSTEYVGWIRGLISAQRAQYRPAWCRPVTTADSQAVLRIGYGAPSPLSL
jgi:hypothetical protein